MSILPRPQSDWAWFLDVDGTLVEIAPTPDAVVVHPELIPILERLSILAGGALALVSGRPVAQILGLFAPFRPAAAGLHGLEILDAAGRLHLPPPPGPELDAIRSRLTQFADGHPGVLLEDKGQTLALHYRNAPEAAAPALAAVEQAVAGKGGYAILHGKMVYEVRPAGHDKGGAVRRFMREAPFAGRRPVFIGDDVTDEDGFCAVNDMGGLSIRIGGAIQPTAAAVRCKSVEALRDWLKAFAEGTG